MITTFNRNLIVLLALTLLSFPTKSFAQFSSDRLGSILSKSTGQIAGSLFENETGKAAATAAGNIAGEMVSKQITAYLNEQDQKQLASATQKSIETGEDQSFTNPETGVTAKTTVVPTKQASRGAATTTRAEECRTVQQEVTLEDGSVKTEEVTACKGADGWVVKS